jgi:hypothetical protein
VELLGRFTLSLQTVRLEQVTSVGCKGEAALALAKLHGLDEPLILKVLKSIARKVQIVFRHDPKRADSGKRPAVFAIQLVHSVAVNDQFALVATR